MDQQHDNTNSSTVDAFRRRLVVLLRRELYVQGEGLDANDRAQRKGWNDRARSLIAWLSQGDVGVGLVELRDAAPVGGCTCRQSPACPLHSETFDGLERELAQSRSLARPQVWAFEIDVEQEAIERAYRELGGES